MEKRYSNRGGRGDRYPGADYDRERRRSGYADGGEYSGYDREEGYFGGARQGFGEGYAGTRQSGGYEQSWRSSGGDSDGGEKEYSRQPRSREQGNYASARGVNNERVNDRSVGGSDLDRGYSADERPNYSYRNREDSRRSGYPSSERNYPSNSEDNEERGWLDKASDTVASWLGDEDAERRRRMDARYSGEHRGRGPKGYKRSDDRIKEDVSDRLTYNSFVDASDVEVEVADGEVTLSGNIASRHEKRLAEDIAEEVSGVSNVENRLRVKDPREGTSFAAGRADHPSGTTGSPMLPASRSAGSGS